MLFLFLASLFWSLSFGLIKSNLMGISPLFLAFIRAFLATLFFAPLFFLKTPLSKKDFLKLVAIGTLEYGVPYVLYLQSYQYLKAYQIVLFLTFTPIYVTLIADIKSKSFHFKNLMGALLAIFGAAIINFKAGSYSNILTGFLLLQTADFSFALGQLLYRSFKKNYATTPKIDFLLTPWVMVGGLLLTTTFWMASSHSFMPNFPELSLKQWSVICYLGIGATGIAYFLWNIGTTKVKPGVLAIMNNMKIPLGVFFALFLFQEEAPLYRTLVGASLMLLALFLVMGKTEDAISKRTSSQKRDSKLLNS